MEYKVKECVRQSVYSDLLEIASTNIDWSALKNSAVLITGAAGFIGFYLCAALALRNDLHGDGIKVTALVRNGEKARAKFGRLLERGDITLCIQDVTQPVNAERADYVIHAASQASNIQFETDPVGTINANLAGTSNVLEFARSSKSKAALIVSSLKVYGVIYGSKKSISEDDGGYLDFTSYKNCYAMGKRASETLAASYCREYGMNVRLVRPGYIYGASSLSDDRVWAQFIANVVRRQDILLKSNGAANRSFCYVTDTVSAMLFVLLNGKNAVPYNISNEKSNTTIRGFAKAACDAFPDRGIKLVFADPKDEPEPQTVDSPLSQVPEILDNSRILALGWQPRVDLTEGIKRSVATLEESFG